MKKISILAIAAVAMSLASCKKDYKCECVTTYDGGSTVVTREIPKASKKVAGSICGNETTVDTYHGYSNTVEIDQSTTACTLK